MEIKFTKQQKQAINTLDKSVLVSAAAGSGKTAVLVQRIIKIILDGEANVDEMLVVTFTKAAASEMRLKLAKAIKKRMKEDPSSKPVLKKQLDRIYRSYISTFDSFAVRVIKEFFYEIDIEPNFSACDEIQSALMKREAVDNLFEEAFEKDDLIPGESFRSFLRLYSSDRSEEGIKTNIIRDYDKLRTMPDYWNWAYESAEDLRVTKANFGTSKLKQAMADDADRAIRLALDAADKLAKLFDDAGIYYVFREKLSPEIESIRELANCSDVDDNFIAKISSIDYVTLRATKDWKDSYDSIKDEVKVLRECYKKELRNWSNRYCLPDFDTRLKEMNDSYVWTVYYLNVLKEFENRYKTLKDEENQLDFADMEHYAVEILNHKEARDTLRNRFKYIFIDEYQDTNNIQEYLINTFARENNVFKVGDVKQSIYRFRQAEPSIFQRVYREYADENNKVATSIDLNSNFRTNDRTIQYINAVFENIMDGYDDRAKLYTGNPEGTGYQDEYDMMPEVHVLCTLDGTPDEQETSSVDEEIENITKEEAEAKYVAGLVRKLLGTSFYDTANKVVRPVESRDIAILLRSVKYRGDVFARELRKIDVQSHIEEADDYFDTVEIGIALSLFQCIDNMKRDVPLVATLHSEVFGWSPEDLASIRIAYNEQGERRAPFWEALEWYSENGDDETLKAKTNFAINQIHEWRTISRMMPIEDFIWKVLVDSSYYMMVGAMYSGDRRQANLRTLVDRARKYSESSVASLSSFLDFLEVMKSKGVSNGQVSMVSKDDDVVRITTIHKSKGLEYPFVIVGGLGHAFKYDNNEKALSFDSKLGVAMPYVSPDRKFWRSTLMQRAINSKSYKESYEEDLRVLYVAMTRARNKLIMVGTTKDEESLAIYTTRPTNFLKVMRNVLHTPYNEYHYAVLEQDNSKESSSHIKEVLASRGKTLSPDAQAIYEEIDRKLAFEYPDKDMLDAKSKYSVSALREEELKDESDMVKPDEEVISLWQLTDTKKKASAADIGIAYHRILEFLDFTKISAGYIEESYNYLVENGAIDETVAGMIDLGKVKDFFTSDIGQRAVAAAYAGTLKKEKPFTLRTNWKGREILVQGVIDCCWEEDGQMVLIDYKTTRVDPSKYQTQLDLYTKALEQGTGKPVKEAKLVIL